MDIAKKLNGLRRAAGFSQQEVAQHLSKYTEPITNRAVSKWETGASLPDAEQFILLCELYGVTDVVSEFLEIGYDSPYSGLNRAGIDAAKDYIALLRNSDKYRAEVRPVQEPPVKQKRTVPLYDITAGRGTGMFLDSDAFVPYESENIPPEANFAVRMSGDSMAPLYNNGQVIFVRSATELETGDIGIFIYNGDAYCRRLDRVDGVKLLAVNERYAPISVKYSYELRIVGRVVE